MSQAVLPFALGRGFDLGRVRFGYRTFTTKDGMFLLNGKHSN